MIAVCDRFKFLLVLAVALIAAHASFAQADAAAAATPEPATVEANPEFAPEAPATAEIVAEPQVETAIVAPDAEAPQTTLGQRQPIEQRVVNREEVIRVEPKPRKNVSRIDNLPNRTKAKPIAVIKGPVSPWGYATRYVNGEVNRPSAKDLQGGGPQGPGAAAGAAQGERFGGQLGGRRPRRGQDED
ncbi:MAG: hypothetical protein IT366_18235 [Candidatus Hydrogenedentes bacterium]|nr:hypothetical protein [Candidatus Hydrogenedentota bacterium]